MFKKLSVLIITLTFFLVNTVNVYAGILDIGSIATGLNGAFNLNDSNEKKRSDLSNWLHQNSQWGGFLFDAVSGSSYLTPSFIYGILPQSVKDQISDSNDESEILDKTIDMILEGQSVSGNNITNNTNINTFLKDFQNTYVNDNKYYLGYSLDLQYYDLPADINNFVQDHDNELVFVKKKSNYWLVFTDNELNTDNYGFVYTGNATEIYSTNAYSLNTFTGYTRGDPGYNQPYASGVSVYIYKNGTFSQVLSRSGDGNTVYSNFIFMQRNYSYRATDWNFPDWANNYNIVCVSYGKVKEIPIYGTSALLQSSERGVMPYYYNEDVWQDFSTSSGDYIFSPTNINTVTYGDVSEYIDNSYQDNDYYPDNSTVNNWIENTNTENITNNNGGGNGGGSGGNGSDNDIGNVSDIFGWLKQLGAVIASLIKGIGEFITEIVTGLVEALTDLLSGIASLISNITVLIPDALMEFLSLCFSWMPSEWIALISASLLFMLLWGIIKTIRGN